MGLLGYEPLENQIEESGCGPSESGRAGMRVLEVASGSLGERAGIRPGDRILEINGAPVRDAIDLVYHAAEPELALRYHSEAGGELKTVKLGRAFGQELGLVVEEFKIKLCNNQCVFCFIHQNPKGLRKGIYFKDGDFRMSFLHGNYITTTNMKDSDFERIIEQKLSPMYVSVHTTRHELRLRMLGIKRSPDIMDRLKKLAGGGIDIHTQIVLCPGWNDGEELESTVRDLASIGPRLLSIAVVPLGLTEHREGLPEMSPATPAFCRETIERAQPLQDSIREERGEAVLFLSDEFYLVGEKPLPDYRDTDILYQLENGVGMVWDFMKPWEELQSTLPGRIPETRSVAILTGGLGARVLDPIVRRLQTIEGLEVHLIECENTLFGKSITVSGLLPGCDFLHAIRKQPHFDRYIIPGNAIRAEGEVFLDDLPFEKLIIETAGRVIAVDGTCDDLIDAVLDPHLLQRSPES